MHMGFFIKKSKMVVFMLMSSAVNLIGAASSSSSQSYSDGRYKVETEFEVASDMVKIGLAHLPSRVRSYVNAIATGSIRSGVVLFEGAPGAAKTTTAKCIGQQYYNNTPAFPGELRSHVFHGSMLTGDQYQNSGVTVLRTNIEPIIARAKDAPQFIVFDEFQKLVKKSENNSSERESAASQILKLFDAMDETNNIIFIGTCNKTKGIPGPIMSRFSDLFRFDQPSADLSAAVLEHYLLKAGIPTTVTTAEELSAVATNFKEGVRQVKHIVNRAKICVLDKEINRGVISAQDLISAINEYNREFGPKKITWEKFFKKHQHKIIVAGTVVTVTIAIVSLCLVIKHQRDSLAFQKANRLEDLARAASERAIDLATSEARHIEMLDLQKANRLEDLARASAERAVDLVTSEARHIELFDFQKNLDIKKEAEGADYSCLVPTAFQDNYLNASSDVKALVDERQEVRWNDRGEMIGVSGDTAKLGTQIAVPVAGVATAGVLGYGAYAGWFAGMSCTIS